MLKLVRRGISANLGRLLLTLVSVVLGVAFVSGSFVLADSLRTIFNQISEQAFAGTDAQVRVPPPDDSGTSELVPFDDSLIETVSALDEVEYAEGGIFAFEKAYTLNAEGELVRPQGPPVFTSSWAGPSLVSSFSLVEGDAPVGQQVALDAEQIRAGGFELGDMVTVSLPGGVQEEFELAGVISFGGIPGAYFILFDLETTQRGLALEGQVNGIAINAASGVSPDEVTELVGSIIPSDLEVVPGETLIGEQQDQFNGFIDIFGNVLLGFALVVLFVSIFIIYNTFAILVGQRTRQLGLLRLLGANRSQVRLLVMIEAVIIGIIASIVGLIGGIGVAWLLKWLFSNAGGGTFPDGPLRILPRTIIVVIAVGLGVTVISAIIPALRASLVSPVEAFRDGGKRERSLQFRLISGGLVLIPGLIALGVGMFGSIEGTAETLSLIGLGAAATFIGVSMMSALFAGPVASFLGKPMQSLRGVAGRLARDNASRNPQRTSATATALMIGLALITGVGVLSASLLATFDDLLEDALTAELFIYEEQQQLPFSSDLVDQLRAIPETDQVAGYVKVSVTIDGERGSLGALDTDTGTAVVNYGIVEGSSDLGDNQIAVLDDKAETLSLALGDTVSVEFDDGFATDLTVVAIYDDNSVVESPWVVSRSLAGPHQVSDEVEFVGLTYADGVDPTVARSAVEGIVDGYPQLIVQDNTEFQQSVSGQISQIQIVINALLVLCLIVAFFGIVNTMALSILERTREIGLLRAVGMTRGQLRSAIRWEAVIVSVFGAVLGVAMGLLLGWAAVVAIPDSFISKVSIPWTQVVVYVVVGAIIGVIAAYFPARRAAKLNVLDAVSAV